MDSVTFPRFLALVCYAAWFRRFAEYENARRYDLQDALEPVIDNYRDIYKLGYFELCNGCGNRSYDRCSCEVY
jgi:hypothetical protein